MPKFCSTGHQMEDSWEICPYCQRTGYGGAHTGAAMGKTRLEFEAMPGPEAAAAKPVRKTVLLSALPSTTPLAGWLVVMNGDQKYEDFRVRRDQTIIGSASDADVVLRDQTVSGKHASLRMKDGRFFLTDLDSTNGTFLNSSDAGIAREEIKDNDLIRVGGVELKFKAL